MLSLCSLIMVAFADEPKVGAFVDVEWRGMAMAEHLSHGPGFAVGASLLGGHLQVGVAGYGRPGPINPARFRVEVPYAGKQEVHLRSDGGAMGLFAAPGAEIVPRLHLDLPLMVGYGGFGFYLHGEDRETPDGRKPSAWENELLDERDSSFGLALEGGVRLAWQAGRHVRPFVAARWSTIAGYDAFVRPSYGGPSLGLGLTLGSL
jgi:hypothetical protein